MKIRNELMDEMGLLALLREDFNCHYRDVTKPGFQAMAVYRFGVWARSRRLYLSRMLFGAIHFVLFCFIRNVYGIEIPYTAKLGRRVHIGHQSGIVIHEFCTMGDDCVVRQNVTIGIGGVKRGHFGPEHAPVIGRHVDFAAGAVVVGNVRIGDSVNIGPNAVIVTDVKSNTTVMAPPARMMARPAANTAAVSPDLEMSA
ncbi:serine acetyltransferase [Rhizobium sullae]|uniref:Serine acetyltransferase n=1 Tax=Rhizobium sullae TaxID=50338 RepID=A0A2N0D1A1_RHISU|nr:serine acetyltransferase [Rhizobium sullae]PKA39893.1 serine acetyltransferase [Rhizobium sullae]